MKNFYRPQTKLREGNVFTPLCHSVHRGRGLCPSMHHRSHDLGVSVQWGGLCPVGVSVQGDSLQVGLCPGGLCPGGSLSGGLCQGGLCPGGSLSRGISVQEGSLLGRRPYGNEQVVRILLECILVPKIFAWLLSFSYFWVKLKFICTWKRSLNWSVKSNIPSELCQVTRRKLLSGRDRKIKILTSQVQPFRCDESLKCNSYTSWYCSLVPQVSC